MSISGRAPTKQEEDELCVRRHFYLLGLLDRDHNLNNRTGIGVGNAQTASQFRHALPHSTNADPNALGTQLLHVLTHSLPIIDNADENISVSFDKAHTTVAGSGMPEHIGEGLLDDAEDGRLEL